MKKLLFTATAVILTLLAGISCKKDDIRPYSVEDGAVVFVSVTNAFSMKGHTEDVVTFKIPVKVIGPRTDYDREIGLSIKDSSAVQGRDFKVVSSVIPAGELTSDIVIEVNRLKEGVTDLAARFDIVENEYFRKGYPKYSTTEVKWTELYARPPFYTWRYWYLYICPGYSQAFHKLLVDEFGTDVEKYTISSAQAQSEPETYIYKSPTWWYAAERQLREDVAAYDAAHPGEPMRHSDDYEVYTTYTVPVGEGTRPEVIPTILETIVVL